jgi:hypothetical protein
MRREGDMYMFVQFFQISQIGIVILSEDARVMGSVGRREGCFIFSNVDLLIFVDVENKDDD